MTKRKASLAAIGFRAHSGWAALVVVGGDTDAPSVIDRRRIELADPAVPGFPQPYHAAEGLQLKQAEKLIGKCVDAARRLAMAGLGEVIDELVRQGYKTVGCGLLLSSGRLPGTLAPILASHALIHAAEGELFREALTHASRYFKLPVTAVRERELFDHSAAALHVPAGELRNRIAEMGRSIGPPWRQDEKLAALVGWLALVA
jgi:hypothetical protein